MVQLPDCAHCVHWRACTLQRMILSQMADSLAAIRIPDPGSRSKHSGLTLEDIGFDVIFSCRNEESPI